ncbi:MAG: hypothetical protein Hyperionvirus11_33 [Hyperionvirus sp.]|uniref:Uncharacterized protein n=1 Tax=Hyperionvirus sp. TaxID=2487770 RepID=A0A3G5A907_9VIRU|nr:MAG: hypothetical protein Hyperionvirus11_33 [Hyperionvirus sp.]
MSERLLWLMGKHVEIHAHLSYECAHCLILCRVCLVEKKPLPQSDHMKAFVGNQHLGDVFFAMDAFPARF